MARYLLDTTVIIDFLRGKESIVSLLKGLADEGSSLGCCPINIAEVYSGMREEREVTEEFLDCLEFYPITREVAKMAGEIRRRYLRRGVTIPLPDAMIAAVAIANDLILLTSDKRHYPMPELKVEEVE